MIEAAVMRGRIGRRGIAAPLWTTLLTGLQAGVPSEIERRGGAAPITSGSR